jgi:hypothetical protein
MIILSAPYCCKMSDHVLLKSQNFTLPSEQIKLVVIMLFVSCMQFIYTHFMLQWLWPQALQMVVGTDMDNNAPTVFTASF